jgi:peptidoglycan/xylan/chitin deacetylase (PgdA/CDA1 family)
MGKIIVFHDVRNIVWFEKVIIVLKNKYNIIDVDRLVSYYDDRKYLKNVCHITVDDGDNSFYDTIYPVLKKYSIPASIYVSPIICREGKNFWFQEISGFNEAEVKKIISKNTKIHYNVLSPYSILMILKNLKVDEIWDVIEIYKKQFNVESKEVQNMNVEQLLEIDRDGLVAIGAHTINHPILANENGDKSKKEIIDSLKGLKEILGKEIKYFAFPNGIPKIDFTEREMNILKNNHCRISFSTEPKDFTSNDNLLSIPRYGISYGSEYFVRAKLLLGKYWDKLKYFNTKDERRTRTDIKRKMQFPPVSG